MRVLVTGGAGYLGSELVRRAAAGGHECIATYFSRPGSAAAAHWLEVDVRDPIATARVLAIARPDVVVHTAIGRGEQMWSTNVTGARVVAAAARTARLIHISSDVVFDGRKGRYREADQPAPVNTYGRSKAEAETAVALTHPEAAIVRTSLLYGAPHGGPQEELAATHTRFFVDEMRSPVHVGDLAAALLELAALPFGGPLHCAGADDLSRYEFAVLLGADPDSLEAVGAPPDRPPDTTLDSSLAASILGTRLRGAREVLR